MLLNLNPVPAVSSAVSPATSAPAGMTGLPANGGLQSVQDGVGAGESGFRAVFQRETAAGTDINGPDAYAPADDPMAVEDPLEEASADAALQGIVVGEPVAPAEELPPEVMPGLDGFVAMIEEMTTRPDFAAPHGSVLPLPAALDALSSALDDLVSLQNGETGDALTGGKAGSGEGDTQLPIPDSLMKLLSDIGRNLGTIAELSTGSTDTTSAAMTSATDIDALAGLLRDANSLLGGGAGTSAGIESGVEVAKLLAPAAVAVPSTETLPADLAVRIAEALDPELIRTALAQVHKHLEAGVDADGAAAVLADTDFTAANLTLPAVSAVAPAVPGPVTDPLSLTAALASTQAAVLNPDLVRAGKTDAFNPQPFQELPLEEVNRLLDEGFDLLDPGRSNVRDLVGNTAVVVESLARATGIADSRVMNPDSAQLNLAQAERAPATTESKPAILGGRADVWLERPAELPEHILHHVNRLHAQSARLHAAGFTDLMQRLTLSLHPEELGQVDVQLRTGDQMTLTFVAREAATRDLLEQNLPRLRQLFESQGLSLGDVNVGSGQAQNRQEAEQNSGRSPGQFTGSRSEGLSHAASSGREAGLAARDRLIDIRA